MPSPFPGMNPYLEHSAFWSDFHSGYIHRCQDALARQVLPRYFVRVEEHVYLHELPEGRARLIGHPDLALTSRSPQSSASAVLDAPAVIELAEEIDEERIRYLEIVDRAGGRVVTVIELLSPSNKMPGPDRDQYLAKRRQLTHAGVHFVELDLLRRGPRTIPDVPACDFVIQIVRAPQWNRVGIWPLMLRDPLPTIAIPLGGDDPEPQLDLMALLHAQYDAVGYGHFIYDREPDPPLAERDRAWAERLLADSVPM